MYILYLDESGNESNPADRYFVYAGIATSETQPHWLTQRLDEVQENHFPGMPPIPFHATKIKAGKGFWRNESKEKRWEVLRDVGEAIGNSPPNDLMIFASVVEKTGKLYGQAAVERAIEDVTKRFDSFLVREYRRYKNRQRGLLIVSEGKYDQRVRSLIKKYRELGPLHNIADIPYFALMKESRILQAADYVAHATSCSMKIGGPNS